jgi:hypothetical protein
MKKLIILLTIIFAINFNTKAQVQVHYAVQAGPTDWQLYMSDKLMEYLSVDGKVVFITLTAGDEGYGNTTFGGSSIAYYLARENGSVRSSKFARDITTSVTPSAQPTAQTVVVAGKSITKYVYGTTVNYFLRLPDGGSNGLGYPGTGNKSLSLLKAGTISSITSVDGTATYTWIELVNTIKTIILAERGTDDQVWLNSADLNNVTNPNDHSDRIHSSMAAQESVSTYLWVGINEFVNNHSSTLAPNLTTDSYQNAAALFGMTDWSLSKYKYPIRFNSTNKAWLPMDYFSVKRSPTGNANTALPVTLLDFYGELHGSNVLLNWSTTAEYNSKEFQIEKSIDGINYHKIAVLASSGNSTTLKNYKYLDTEATELNYYRLKMVDIDGFTKQSQVVVIKNTSIVQRVYTTTSPFTDYINIRFAKTLKGKISLRLIDMSGKVCGVSENYQAGTSIVRFESFSKSLNTGIYILQVEVEGQRYSIKLMKAK